MPDLALRFDKDMLVLSTSFDYQLQSQGFTDESDREYVVLCEPELIDEAYKLEKAIGTPCLVAPTEGITEARLSHGNYTEDAANAMAASAFEKVQDFSPQHSIAAIGPCGLPLDPSSAPSLKQSRFQYQNAVKALTAYPFDAVFFCGFDNLYDAQCALTGARAVYDGPLIISFSPDADGVFPCGRTLAEGVALCDEYGADVIGLRSGAAPEKFIEMACAMRAATNKPLLAEVVVNRVDKRQFEPTEENPYPQAGEMTSLAVKLFGAGVQFLRAVGAATPAYTGALYSTVSGHDVHLPSQG